jgi:predicted nucleic acid-binding protein
LIGILKVAKQRGEIAALRPYLEQLRDLAGFRISPALYERVLREMGEL